MPNWQWILTTVMLCIATWIAASTPRKGRELYLCASPVKYLETGGHVYIYEVHQRVHRPRTCMVNVNEPNPAVEEQIKQDFSRYIEENVEPNHLGTCSLLHHNETAVVRIKWVRKEALETIGLSGIHCGRLSGTL